MSRRLGKVLGITRGGAHDPAELVVDAAKAVDRMTRLHSNDEHLMTAAGAELHAMEAARTALDEASGAKRPELAARLAQNFARKVQESADFAMSVTASTFSRFLPRPSQGDEEGFVRVADAMGYRANKMQAQGDFLDLSGGALEGAAELDVAQSLVPGGMRPRAKLSLLGLVAAMSHEAVFRKVQEALRSRGGNQVTAPYLTIREYLAARGASGAADLVNTTLWGTVAGAALQRPVRACLLAAICVREPSVQIVAWGARLASVATALHAASADTRIRALKVLDALASWELFAYTGTNVLYGLLAKRAGEPTLSVVDAVLSSLLFVHTLLVNAGRLPPMVRAGQIREATAAAPPSPPAVTAADAEIASGRDAGAEAAAAWEAEAADVGVAPAAEEPQPRADDAQ